MDRVVRARIRQRDHARKHNQDDRAELFNGHLKRVIQETT
jgi:hypothetical protein